ncbi:MAG: tyrosine/phenylalanine carboxypeptidase domain-containing protein [Myxococcota bacterium]
MRTRAQLELDARLRRIDAVARLVPAATARNGLAERQRLREALRRDQHLEPCWEPIKQRVPRSIWRDLREARTLAAEVSPGDLYLARLDELELELMLLESLGDAKRVRPLAARRYGTGAARVEGRLLRETAATWLATLDAEEPEPRVVPAEGPNSLAELIRRLAAHVGVRVTVHVEPSLVANAACGERTIFLADRAFGIRESRRLAVHEVLGHLTAAANGRAQPIAILQVGTAQSLADQEGLALCLEEDADLLDARRRRTFAARVWVSDQVHAGVPFDHTARLLVREYGFLDDEAIALAERAYRGGGVARDAIYLAGYLRVRAALDAGMGVDELRLGRVSVEASRTLQRLGVVREGLYCPSLSRSLAATTLGTSSSTSPPSLAASLMRFDET